ncbi:nephrin [Trichonephila clavipes]|nr:nephrin [Trichonephila clavipes]
MMNCQTKLRINHWAAVKSIVILENRPVLLKEQLQRRVAAGERDSAELVCIASGNPAVTFAWSFNGSTISTGQSESPKYSVRQRRKHGIPDPPEALESMNVSHQGSLLVWAPGFDGGLTQSFQLRIQKNQEAPVTFIHIPMNSTSYLLSGLEQGTSYEVSISAKNALGESPYTSPITFKTKSLPIMDSTMSGPVSSGSSSMDFLPAWLLAAAVIGGLVVVANLLICIIYIRRKQWCRTTQACKYII